MKFLVTADTLYFVIEGCHMCRQHAWDLTGQAEKAPGNLGKEVMCR